MKKFGKILRYCQYSKIIQPSVGGVSTCGARRVSTRKVDLGISQVILTVVLDDVYIWPAFSPNKSQSIDPY